MVDMGTVLAVNLEAKINKLEKEMRRAGDVGARAFDRIERRSKQSSQRLEQNMAKAGEAVRRSLSGLDKMLLGGLATGGVAAFGMQVRAMVGDVAALGDQAKRAGVSLKAFQEWKHVAEQNRIPIDSMTDALKELSIRADEFAATGKGSAADAFARLGMKPEEVKRKLADPSALLLELIERTRQLGDTAAGVRSFDELFGGSGGERLVALLSKSQDELRGTIRQAHDLGLVLSDELVEGAADLDAKFNAVANTVGSALKSAIVEAATALSSFIERFQAFEAQSTNGLKARMAEIGFKRVELENQVVRQQSMLDRGETGWFGVNAPALEDQIRIAKEKMGELSEQEREILAILDQREPLLPIGTAPPPTPTTPALLPPRGSTGGVGGGSSGRNAYADIVAQAQQFIAQQQLEQRALSLTAEAAATLRQQHELLNQAQAAGLALTPQQRAEIEQLGAAMAAAEQQTKALTDAQEASQQAGQFAAGGLSDAFTNIVMGASSAEDAIKGLTDQLIRALIQAALLGSGPLSGLTGGAGLLGGLFGFASGGYTGPGGKYEPAGIVHRGEVVWSQADVARHGGPAAVDAMRKLPRFADGGVVGRIAPLPAGTSTLSTTVAPTINVTVEGGSRGPEADAALGKSVAKEIEAMVLGTMIRELARQRRPGNTLNTRSQ